MRVLQQGAWDHELSPWKPQVSKEPFTSLQKPSILSKQPLSIEFYQSSPSSCHTSPAFNQKSLTSYQKSPVFYPKSPTFCEKSPTLSKRALNSVKRALYSQKGPIFPAFYQCLYSSPPKTQVSLRMSV